jgi:hypothetical protein
LKTNLFDSSETENLSQEEKEKQLIKYKQLCQEYTEIWRLFFAKSLENENLEKPLT